MLKLIIVDDEKMILDSMSSLVNWEALGIRLIGTCKDGVEAYNMIIDESPDIIITDIKMPGLDGLELIKRSLAIDSSIEFVILSGYQEFEFAKKAMELGVQHYLIKPCSEEEICQVIENVKQIWLSKKNARELQAEHIILKQRIASVTIKQYLIEGLIASNFELYLNQVRGENLLEPGLLLYVYYMEEYGLKEFISQAAEVLKPFGCPTMVYVKNTIMMLLPCCQPANLDYLIHRLEVINYTNQSVSLSVSGKSFPDMETLLKDIMPRIQRYSKIYFLNYDGSLQEVRNHASIFGDVDTLLSHASKDISVFKTELRKIFIMINEPELVRILSFRIITSLQKHMNIDNKNSQFVSLCLQKLTTMATNYEILEFTVETVSTYFVTNNHNLTSYKSFIKKAMDYANQHISDPNLSLKYIAEEYLFMNVDYVSREFNKETGEKFSAYLTKIRMEKAKLLLQSFDEEKIYIAAEQVGCYNPQYFSQIFKKYTGISPTSYIQRWHSDKVKEVFCNRAEHS